MKKFNWILSILVSLGVLFFCGFIINKNKQAGSVENGSDAAKNVLKSEAIESLVGAFENNLIFGNMPLQLKLEDIYGNSKDVDAILGNKTKLFFRYSELNCDLCVDSALTYFTAFAKRVGEDNVVLLAEYESTDYLAQFIRINKLRLPNIYRVLNNDSTTQHTGLSNAPFLFVMNNSHRMMDVLYPLKEFPELSQVYYETMYQKHFKKS